MIKAKDQDDEKTSQGGRAEGGGRKNKDRGQKSGVSIYT